jgi:XTP/dITP diphosphohydrolase
MRAYCPQIIFAMSQIIFATNNLHKLSEIRQIVSGNIHIVSLSDIGFVQDIPETSDSIAGNALQKAWFIHDIYKTNCFADDTGLEVEALGGDPGVYSARYAGPGCTYGDNVKKLLDAMKGVENRKARFVTVIAMIYDNKQYLFEGVINGIITSETRGGNGFGYDPVFQPENHSLTFAQMDAQLKNSISHRGLATTKLIKFLNESM